MAATVTEVVVVGGGVIGLACAWRLAQRGLEVVVVDPAPGAAASHAAAGMLAPVSEATYGESVLLQLDLESLRRYPDFVAELEGETGQVVGLRREGTLIVATDAGDRAMLADLHTFQSELGLRARMLTSRECRAEEPGLSPAVRCGLLAESDHSVDNRRLVSALRAALDARHTTVVEGRAETLLVDSGRAVGVTLESGDEIRADSVVLAAGPWSGELGGLPPAARPRVRPVKGQILRLRAGHPAALPRHTIRGFVNGHDIYLVPRSDGELVVGASVEDVGFDRTVRAGAVRELLRDARAVVPGIDEMELVESIAAFRPGSPDNAPMIGATGVDRLTIATGHYRNGILLTPVTADLVAAVVTATETADDRDLLKLASPQRFLPADGTSEERPA